MQNFIEPNNSSKNNPLLPFYFSIVLAVGVGIGYFLTFNSNFSNSNPEVKGNKINNIMDYISLQYVDSINRSQLENKIILTMLKGLDPHSDYIPAENFSMANETLEGNFDGIGVEFNIINDTIRVINTISGGPSEKIGIKAGDKIIKVDGKNLVGNKVTNKNVFEKLRGNQGSKVKVTLLRININKPLEFTITRGKIPIYSIDYTYIVKPGVGYIKLSRFASTTYDEYLKAFNDLSKQGMKKLILDLRGNGGGFLNTAVELADEFLMNGLQIVFTEGRSHPKKIYTATTRGGFEKNELVVLIDEGSASASEIVAGALQDNDRATIIGRRSFGKGLVQDQLNLPDGSALRLTIARYYTPTGRCIQKNYDKSLDEYYNEEVDRFEHGELYNKDSVKIDKTKRYQTPAGKIVYGGGGIMPDIFVALDSSKYNAFINLIYNNGILTSFAFEYTDAHRTLFLNKYKNAKEFILDFKVAENEIIAFKKYLKSTPTNNFNFKDGGFKEILKALIGRNLFDKDAYYPIINKTDNTLLKALEVLDKKKN